MCNGMLQPTDRILDPAVTAGLLSVITSVRNKVAAILPQGTASLSRFLDFLILIPSSARHARSVSLSEAFDRVALPSESAEFGPRHLDPATHERISQRHFC